MGLVRLGQQEVGNNAQELGSPGGRTKGFRSFFKIALTPQLELDSTPESLTPNHIPKCGVQAEMGTGSLEL